MPDLTWAIEGNIGAGKSALLARLPLIFPGSDMELVSENVSLWENFPLYGGPLGVSASINVLGSMYDNPRQWAFRFQNLVFLSQTAALNEAPSTGMWVSERSIHSGYHVFCKELHFADYLGAD